MLHFTRTWTGQRKASEKKFLGSGGPLFFPGSVFVVLLIFVWGEREQGFPLGR